LPYAISQCLDIPYLHSCLCYIIANNGFTGSVPGGLATIPSLEEIYVKLNGFTVSLEADFCGTSQKYFTDLEADCAGANPLVECSCCTVCCEGLDCAEQVVVPQEAPPASTLPPAQAQERFNTLVPKLEVMSGPQAFQDSTTPQYQAAWWLASADPATIDFDTAEFDTIVQRYIMTLLYYSTKGESWKSQQQFLIADDVCNWSANKGVDCNSAGLITAINIGKLSRSLVVKEGQIIEFVPDDSFLILTLTI
jgi:hypothetical protein